MAAVVVLGSWARADIPLRATRLASGLHNPLFVTAAPGEPNLLYILEQTGVSTLSTSGVVRTFDLSTNTLNPSPFLTIPDVATGNEQGLLGLAFHPNYATNGKLYLDYTLSNGSIQISEFARQTGTAAFSKPILTIPHPGESNHNGGWLGFKPGSAGGNLYIGVGDGGSGNDPPNNAQNTSALLGKMLRINIDADDFETDSTRNYGIPAGNPFNGTDGAAEIWHYGLRNPWRNSFDRQTGDLYIGDVGQDTAEEIDFQASGDAGGKNFGWRKYEGANLRPNGGSSDSLGGPSPHTPPIHEYPHNGGSRSITGGYVYRGSENDALQGTYFFAEFITSQIWSFKYDGTTKTRFRELTGTIVTDTGTINNVSSFGEDAAGNLYIVDRGGEIFRLIPPMSGDTNLDDLVDVTDLGALALHWNEQGTATWAHGDFTDDGNVNVADLYRLALHWPTEPGSPSLSEALAALDLPPVNVPEPGVAAVVGVMILMGWRRR
jgi:glucose/arabinose dehydrogenase